MGWEQPHPSGSNVEIVPVFYIVCMEKLPFSLFSSEKQISQVFPVRCSCCFFFSSKCAFRIQLSGLVFVSLLFLMKDHVGDEHIKRYHERLFDIDIIIDTLCGRPFLPCVLPGAIA